MKKTRSIKIFFKIIKIIQSKRFCKIRFFASFVGLLVSACPAIKCGWAYTKSFERLKFLELSRSNQNYDAIMPLTTVLNDDLDWWATNISQGFNNIRRDKFDLEIFTDASLTGWGAYSREVRTHGWWSV
ncbi:hypothetical protein NQ314_012413 [Rhamnusium bicolor]|uniref:Uncharacterized protein n=1 Tax=Rhamnusium bicolor TaxID=1586634 RepID=A0AAV8XD31_9CUCU|nr:hypothetical protein NQ314_012413 [Rhamnusium bicolor]